MKVTAKKISEISKAELMVYCIRQPLADQAPTCPHPTLAESLARAHAAGDFTGKEGQSLLSYPPPTGMSKKGLACTRMLVVGLGNEELNRELFRKCGGTIAQLSKKTKACQVVVVVPEELEFPLSDMAQALTEGLVLGNYSFLRHKSSDDDEESPRIITEAILCANKGKELKLGVARGVNGAEAACRARDMDNEPANHWTATHFASYAKTMAKEHDLKCTVLGKSELSRLKMGGLLAVNQGSGEPPKLVIVEYRTGKKVPTVLLVGKGLTFDSGGISIKPSSGMHEMKYDMCGGAAVLACMEAVARERPRGIDIVAMVPATDNMPGPDALKPGDVITQYNGKTVEIISTDAEGRLILADALAYGIKRFKPRAVVDVATLTGAVITGLGHHTTGLMANDDELAARVSRAAEASGEPVWRLPLSKEYRKQIDSKVADLKNVGDKGAGTITAGAFLQEFVGDTPWVHLDIAGTAWDFTEKSYIPKGPSGIGVRLLLEMIRDWQS